jgi:hypothetical protein
MEHRLSRMIKILIQATTSLQTNSMTGQGKSLAIHPHRRYSTPKAVHFIVEDATALNRKPRQRRGLRAAGEIQRSLLQSVKLHWNRGVRSLNQNQKSQVLGHLTLLSLKPIRLHLL